MLDGAYCGIFVDFEREGDSLNKRSVGIFLFDDAEVLDFAGPYEVFAVTS